MLKCRVYSHEHFSDESIGLKFILNQSELFRIIPISEKRFVSRLMKNGQKSIRMNPNQSEPNLQSESIRIIPTLDSFGLLLIENSVWSNLGFGLVRIHSD